MISSNDMVQEMFDYLESVQDKMSQGDEQFYLSLSWQFQNRGPISESQVFYLEKIYAKYDSEALDKAEQFAENYSADHRLMALRCAHYYDSQFPRYYGNIVDKVLHDPEGHTLNYSEFGKLCENKYAKKILSSYSSPLKFCTGDMVQIRANNRIDLANRGQTTALVRPRSITRHVANKACLILESNSLPITRAAKGARIYKVLVIDEASPIYAHESDLKKIRRTKK